MAQRLGKRSMIFALLCSQILVASEITWNATSPANDLNTAANWLPTQVPGNTDDALFDSSIGNIATNPTANANFTVLSLDFINSAAPFSFAFNNCSLTFSGIGIQGAQTNTTIAFSNIDNSTPLVNQANFDGPLVSSGGAASISFLNSGTASGASSGSSLSNLSAAQLNSAKPFTMSSGGSLSFTNQGMDNSTGSGNNNLAGIGNQAVFSSPLIAGDSLLISVTNTGTDTSVGPGGNSTGIVGSSQVEIDGEFTVGNNASITVSNSGINSSSGQNSSTGVISADQFVCGPFSAGNNLTITLTNNGVNTGPNNSAIGFVENDLLHFGDTFTALDNATISVTNSGSNSQGSGTIVGSSVRFLFEADGTFTAGDQFNFTVSNSGVDTSSGTSNVVGSMTNGYEAYFASDVNLGNNATIAVSNSGSYTGTDQTCLIGSTQDQFLVAGTFTAGENLSITVTNNAINPNQVPNVGQSINQLIFLGSCNFSNGTYLSVTNSNDGLVGNQMYFQSPFTLTGKAIFEAINTGSIGNGIGINASVGGDINIILQNSSLLATNSTISTPFTIGALNGDAPSTATCDEGLNINTDDGVSALFAGTMYDFMGIPMSLVKAGPGTQTLSGNNTFTGQTTVQGGTFVLNGSLAGPLQITSLGTLKGTGSVAGAVVNTGTISPGQSIGTLTFLSTFTNNGGTYDVEVNGAGQSDLISVGGAATLNGGQVVVSSVDGTFLVFQPYTILQAASVTGTFTGASTAALVIPTLTYDPQHVFLTLTANIAGAAITSNQQAVAQQLDNITNPNAQQLLLLNSIVSLPTPAAREALTSLSGYQHTFDFLTTGTSTDNSFAASMTLCASLSHDCLIAAATHAAAIPSRFGLKVEVLTPTFLAIEMPTA